MAEYNACQSTVVLQMEYTFLSSCSIASFMFIAVVKQV